MEINGISHMGREKGTKKERYMAVVNGKVVEAGDPVYLTDHGYAHVIADIHRDGLQEARDLRVQRDLLLSMMRRLGIVRLDAIQLLRFEHRGLLLHFFLQPLDELTLIDVGLHCFTEFGTARRDFPQFPSRFEDVEVKFLREPLGLCSFARPLDAEEKKIHLG